MPKAKVGISRCPQSYNLNNLSWVTFSGATVGAGQATTSVPAHIFLGTRYKIAKVAISVRNQDIVDGTEAFNLVVGGITAQTGMAYNQNNAAPNDNSYNFDPTLSVGASSQGYPTNIAVAGQTVFANDVPFNSANLYASNPNGVPGDLAGRAAPNTGWSFLTAGGGGVGIFVPTNYDAVYPETQTLSLRMNSTATTGAITGAVVCILVEPIGHGAGDPYLAGQYVAMPGQDF